jgi:hypothetical protein
MRVESVGLKDHGNSAIRWIDVINVLVPDPDVALGEFLKAGDKT